ncbi:MAG: type II toxin-antitoxin system RelE/ParE family toxin [Bacteroidia bacterium]|nr:type II toxin-antitoxin system RelE/ParE family toxin [Bacteroidia bacterium]
MEQTRQIIYYKNYFFKFFDKQTDKVKIKIDQVLFVITVADRIPKKFFDHMTGTDGLYEVRIELGSNIFRVFCCFDEGNIIVLFNGFQKKTQKTPQSEIDRALRIKKEYFDEKLKNEGHENKRKGK